MKFNLYFIKNKKFLMKARNKKVKNKNLRNSNRIFKIGKFV